MPQGIKDNDASFLSDIERRLKWRPFRMHHLMLNFICMNIHEYPSVPCSCLLDEVRQLRLLVKLSFSTHFYLKFLNKLMVFNFRFPALYSFLCTFLSFFFVQLL